MPDKKETISLSKREKQILDVVYELGKASVVEVHERIESPPSVGALRRLMNILREKNLLQSEFTGPTNYYFPLKDTGKRALSGVVNTFFKGSAAKAMSSLVEESDLNLSNEEYEFLSSILDRASKDE